jgi:hypothetical protein
MKILKGVGFSVLLLACVSTLLVMAPIPARADSTSDMAQCEKTVKFKTGDIIDDDVAVCMQGAGYVLDGTLQMDTLTQCHNMLYPGIEVRCYRKPGVTDTSKVPAPVPPNWQAARIEALLAQETDWRDKCRNGMVNKFLTQDVCNRRDRLVMVLQARGLCFEADDPKDLAEANKKWQDCRKDK